MSFEGGEVPRVLVVGGAGYIGSTVVFRLLSNTGMKVPCPMAIKM